MCFAWLDGRCRLLVSFVKTTMDVFGQTRHQNICGTKFPYESCPFMKTVEEAGGTYDQLAHKWPI